MNFLISEQELKVSLKTYDINIFPKEETLMSIGNGQIVSRGANDEANTAYSRETYISGLFDSNRDHEVEELVNVPDVFEYIIYVNGAKLDFNSTNIYDYEKTLDLRLGVLSKSFMVYHGDLEIFVKSSKYCEMANKNIIVQELEYTTNKACDIKIIDKIDGQYTNQGVEHLTYDEKYVSDNILNYYTKTSNGQELYISSKLETNYDVNHNFTIKRKVINRETAFTTKPGISVSLKKTSEFSNQGFTACESDFTAHKQVWEELWNQARVIVDGDKQIQQALDFSTYHLIINSNLDNPNTNLGAKGMTGFGYKGHTFWDTEIFLLPFYISNFPQQAKSLLIYRANSLVQAKLKAEKYGFEGAMMPWEGTNPNSPDATPEYGPINIKNGKVEKIINAEKELHINSAVVYGFEMFYNYTGDAEFIKQYGVEVIIEIAKFWLSRLTYNQANDYYEILDVVGPDEYKEHVNNNMYTNYTAKRTIELIKTWYDLGIVTDHDLVDFDMLASLEIAKKIKQQKPNRQNIIGQDDTYLDLDIIDLSKFKNSSKVAEINKYYSMADKCKIQVGKQADLLLLFQMYRDQFDPKLVEDNFVYYEDKCLHDSSLSLVTHNIVACDLEQTELAYQFFEKSYAIDYTGDLASSNEGIHFASMGGHWLSMIRGFANIFIGDRLEISPRLPKGINQIEFTFHYQYQPLKIELSTNKVKINNLGNHSIECTVFGSGKTIEGAVKLKLQNNSNTIVLSDSFKATISSQEIGQLWQTRCGFDYLPVSDGGEGALDALSAILKGEYITINGIDLYIDNKTAYIETAKVVGYDPSKDVYTRNTLDLGTTIYKLTTMDITKIVIFIGGTSTNDGGFGILSALGYKFLDKNNNRINPLPANFAKIVSIEKSPLPEVEIIGCTDVFNSLCGEAGATFTYGTQKGVTNHQLLDDEISRIASLIDVESIKTCGSGAGGGIGYAITQFKDYTIIDGYSYISNLIDYQQLIAKYQTVITGEGRLDGQTINGKLPFRILNDAKQSQTKVEGVFAVTEDSSLIDQFNAIYNVAVDNKINDYNLEHAVENYQNFITKYKFNHGIYKGILFDLDGVLCDTAELHYLAWKRLANELGGDIDKEFNETLKGVDRSESLRRILAKIDITLNEEQFNEAMELKNTWYVESLDTLSSADILPGVEQFLQQILDHGFKIAIASASKNAPHILDKIGLTKFVDTIANPEDVKVNKPAPDIFLLAAEQLGLNNYECIGIEDSQAGIDALNSGIIDSIAIGDVLENATIKLSSTSQLSLDLLK